MTGQGGYFERNLNVLRELGQTVLADRLSGLTASGRVVVSAAKSGDPTMSFEGRTLHSQYDPKREAASLIQRLTEGLDSTKPLVIVGMGLGYLVEAMPVQWRESMVVAYEPIEDIARAALENRDLSEELSSVWFVAGNVADVGRQIASELGDDAQNCQIVVNPAWNEIRSGLADVLKSSLRNTSKQSSERLKILLVGPVYGGSLPVTGYVQNALRQLGHKVEWLDVSPLKTSLDYFQNLKASQDYLTGIHNQYVHLISQSVLARALEYKPQLVFFMAQAPATPDLLNELKKHGMITAMWFVEDGERFAYGEKMAPFYDVFFHIQRGEYEEKLRRAGARNVHFLPMAADPEVHRSVELTDEERERFGSDVSHVGAGYPNRRSAFRTILGYNFKLWGSDWDGAEALAGVIQENGRRVETDEIVKIFNASKINLNLHSSMDSEAFEADGDFVNPRTFEVAASGAFQLVDERSQLADMFIPGVEIETFASLQELHEKIDHYLEHPEEAARIAKAGQERVLLQHTYRHRMEEAIRFIRSVAVLPEASQSRGLLGELREEAGDDPELEAYLDSLIDVPEEITLDELGKKIRSGEGELSRPEAILMLMDEFNHWAKEKGLA